MKPLSGDPTCTSLDGDECVEIELDIASFLLSGGALEDAPERIFLHLLECPLCRQTALACMEGLAAVDRLLDRLSRERDAPGREWSEDLPFRRTH